MHTHTAGHYQAQAVDTAGPARLVLMLYDGALGALTRAEQALASTDPVVRIDGGNRELQRAQDIVSELSVTLDHDRGGAVAANLAALYDFCLDRLVTANVRKDPDGLDAVRDVLAGLRGAWAQACCLGDG